MSQDAFSTLLAGVVIVLFVWGAIARFRRRAAMTPEARAAEDLATELRRNTRELRRHKR
jgi:hypothetical protein